jgi:nicotinamide-nucleotide amidase
MKTMAGILAIGNEVVEGQITNRNASWLSEQLMLMGIQPLYQLACRDNSKEIQSSLNYLSRDCHLIIVSGGLGPTRDDCTRKSLSEWLGYPLEIDEDQWICIKHKLTQRQVTLREGHKDQAYLPHGSYVLDNKVGVAPGFFIQSPTCFVASLPGPPYELQTMFEGQLKPLIEKKMAPKSDETLETWICLGAPESEVAHIAESIIGQSFDIGYRLHKPYVEVKVWTPKEKTAEQKNIISRLEKKLQPWLVSRSISDIRQSFGDFLKQYDHVFITDHLTSGLMLEKLKEGAWSDHLRYQCFEHRSFRFFDESEIQKIIRSMDLSPYGHALLMSLFPTGEHTGIVTYNERLFAFQIPRNIPIRSGLGQHYAIEQCFLNYKS